MMSQKGDKENNVSDAIGKVSALCYSLLMLFHNFREEEAHNFPDPILFPSTGLIIFWSA